MNKLFFILLFISATAIAQDKGIYMQRGPSYYERVIIKELYPNRAPTVKPARRVFIMDQSNYQLPNKKNEYTYAWHFPPISQGSSGTCWCFSTLSFYESDIKRITGKEIKLSEMFIVYHEYVLKAARYVATHGKSLVDEGSEANAVKRIIKMYGLIPEEAFIGNPTNLKFYFHDSLKIELTEYLDSITNAEFWDSTVCAINVKKILDKHIGQIPNRFKYQGKNYTPLTFLAYTQFNPDDYIDILSYKQEPFNKFVEYKVPDNWWHDSTYYNVTLDTFMYVLKHVVKNGYTVAIGGDVTESGLNVKTQCAMVPSFDIPASAINDDARQFRFNNKTTTDDHGMHAIGYTEKDGKLWFLFKDSGSISSENDESVPEFRYFFFHEDYVKLKMMDFQVHKSALKGVLNL